MPGGDQDLAGDGGLGRVLAGPLGEIGVAARTGAGPPSEFSGVAEEPRFLIIARSRRDEITGESGRLVRPGSLSAELRARLILYGALTSLQDAELIGVALAVQAPARGSGRRAPRGGADWTRRFRDIEIHDWEFGGRR